MHIDKVRKKAAKCYENCLINNIDDNEKKIYEDIMGLLNDNACFIKINVNLALNILIKIGYSKEEAKQIYISLVNECQQILNGKYILADELLK